MVAAANVHRAPAELRRDALGDNAGAVAAHAARGIEGLNLDAEAKVAHGGLLGDELGGVHREGLNKARGSVGNVQGGGFGADGGGHAI